MLDEQKRRLAAEDEVFDLHAGKGVDVVERLVPEVEVGALAQAQGQQRLFLLPVAEFFGVGFQMGAAICARWPGSAART